MIFNYGGLRETSHVFLGEESHVFLGEWLHMVLLPIRIVVIVIQILY